MRVQMGVLLCLCFTHLFFVIFFAAQRSNFMTVPTGKHNCYDVFIYPG